MAAPLSVTTKNLGGVFVTNKQLSDSTDELLRLQGVPWYKRNIAKMFNITLSINHYTDDSGVEHIDMEQKLSATITPLTGRSATVNDSVFGLLHVKTHRLSLESIEEEFLKAGWTEDTVTDGVIHTVISNDPEKPDDSYTWKSEQTWGFQLVNGERKHVRLVSLTSSSKKDGPQHVRIRVVYDYCKSHSSS
ncbi:hypothetical protein EDD15DRAFT_2209659 [Pisolithus albus]|nr:hypothetical protein EDD15DRAFT_2209659 [Pisolithus albus]